MLRSKGEHDDEIEFECPECGTIFKASERDAAKGLVKCPRGHQFAVMGMLGGDGDDVGPHKGGR